MAKRIPPKIWGTGEIITTEALNQIEENADPRRDYNVVQSNTFIGGNFVTVNTLTLLTATVLSLVTRTGRIRIQSAFNIAENLAATATYDMTYLWGTTSTPNINVAGSGTIMSVNLGASDQRSVAMGWVLTGLSPDTEYFIGFAAARSAGTGRGRIGKGMMMIEDF